MSVPSIGWRGRRSGANSIRCPPTERVVVAADFVHDQNSERFVQMVRVEPDPQKRLLIERLLTEERANTSGADGALSARPTRAVA